MSYTLPTTPDFSPTGLNYIAALRGIAPRDPGVAFSYAQLCGNDTDALLCLAASNPEGRFFGLMQDSAFATQAQNTADQRSVTNISFLSAPLSQIADKAGTASDLLPMLDYIVADTTILRSDSATLDTLYALAEKKLNPAGLLSVRYLAQNDMESLLRFLINELSPSMSVEQANEFLIEIKSVSTTWIDAKPQIKELLNQAIAKALPDDFFLGLGGISSDSVRTLSVMEGLFPRGFSFVGDAVAAHNYLELSTPSHAHATLLRCRDSLYYECVKDLAMNRTIRNDIWCRRPVEQTNELPALFGKIAYGTTLSQPNIPSEVSVHGKSIDLSQHLFASILDLTTSLPMTVGDYLAHDPSATPEAVIEALQVLIAVGLLRPMRTGMQIMGDLQTSAPKWALSYNSYHNITPVTTPKVGFASKIVGGSVILPALDAIVLQAVGRVGLPNSAGAVFLEMQRIAQDPVMANAILNTTDPTPDLADKVTKEIVGSSLVRWYAYGLLAA